MKILNFHAVRWLERHQKKRGERKFGCDICSKKFFDTKTLSNHKVIHFDEKGESIRDFSLIFHLDNRFSSFFL